MNTSFEASELGWGVGMWADEIKFEGLTYKKATVQRDNDNDIQYVAYVSNRGGVIKVFND